MLGTVEPGDEILTVGGIYGIVQELEPDEDGGDLIVEIADGIHVRIARRALATVVKPEDEDDEDDDDDEDDEDDATTMTSSTADAELVDDARSSPPTGVEEVNGRRGNCKSGSRRAQRRRPSAASLPPHP